MIKEIGSEFWEVNTGKINNLFSKNFKWFCSGTSALRAILKDIKIENKVTTVAIPSWCCECMITPFKDEGLDINFYSVYYENRKLRQDINNNADIIVVMDYFGFNSEIDMKFSDKIIIRDITHSIFSKQHNDADYYVGSLRKWTGFYTGGFALKKGLWSLNLNFKEADKYYLSLRKQGMKAKHEYILGKDQNKDFLELFKKGENRLDKLKDIMEAYPEDIFKAKVLDIEFIKTKRHKNAKYLLENIKFDEDIQAIFSDITVEETPLFIPILAKNRDKLKKKLIENKIYCPTHWEISKHHNLTEKELYIYMHEISIICDQRYNISDMQRICNVINQIK